GSLAYHRHHASMTGFGEHKERYLLERNALFTLYKNVSDRTLEDALPAAMALAVRRGVALGGLDAREFELRRGGDDGPAQEVPRLALAPVYAIDSFVDELPGLRADREAVQASRVVPDSAISLLVGRTDAPVLDAPEFVEGYENLVEAFDVADGPRARKVLVITGDPIGAKLAGPAIRAWNMAAALSREHEVVLVSLAGVSEVDAPFRVVHVPAGDDRSMGRWEQWCEVVVFQGTALSVFQSLKDSQKIIVADVYDPMHLEALEQARPSGWASWTKAVADATDILDEQLQRADFMLAASERQRHLYLGQLAGLGRLTPALYEGDPGLRGLLDVVPFGLPSTLPRHERAVVKGVVPGIGPDDQLILWGGGLYNWFDPETLVRAVALLAERRPRVRLFFQGTRHPNPAVPEMEIVARTRELARELGVLDRHVFLNDSWVDYADRQNYLLEADLGVSTHFDHIETEFSFRTRILDYLWAGLPMVVTEGDHFADLVEARGLGIAVPAEQVEVLADALERMLFDDERRTAAIEAVARVREESTWERVLQPLLRFVADPAPARDRVAGVTRRAAPTRRKRAGVRHDLSLVGYYLKAGGPSLVFWKVRNRLRRRSG
ncbi:glycosyltransferase family 4 protein, partial [Schumannella luteola]